MTKHIITFKAVREAMDEFKGIALAADSTTKKSKRLYFNSYQCLYKVVFKTGKQETTEEFEDVQEAVDCYNNFDQSI